MRRPLLATSLFVACLLFLSTVSGVHAASIIRAPNNLGLVGYWSFDEGRGDHASDLSGNGNDGYFVGNRQWGPGKVGGAIEFDGSSNVRIPDFDISTHITVSAWVNPDVNQSSKVVGKHSNSADVQGTLAINGGDAAFEITVGGTYYNLRGSALPLNTWSLVTAAYDGSVIRLYVDGEQVASNSNASGSIVNNNLTWSIGSISGGSLGGAFTGSVDEVRIYSRALSPTEIQNLYNNTKGVIVGTTNNTYTDGLVAHYTFDGSTISGNTLKDVVGSNDGTIPGGPTPTIGRIGQGMRFNGQNTNGINLGNSPTLNPNRFTVAAWVKVDVAAQYNYIYSNARDCCTSYNGIDLRVRTDGTVGARIVNGTNERVLVSESGSVPPGLWTHVVFSYDGSHMRIYVNGEVKTSIAHTTDPGTPATYNTRLGSMGHANGATYTLNGSLDDVRLYNRALSPEEIRGLAGSSIATLHSSSDNLVTSGLEGHWSFDTSTISGTTVADISGNNRHGTITGATETSGIIGGALQFDGVDDRVAINAPLNNPENWSYAFWMRADGTPSTDSAGLVGQTNNPRTTFGTGLTVGTGAEYTAGGWAGGVNSSPLSIGSWYHVTAVWQNASSGSPTGQLYINGELVGSRTYAGAIKVPNQTHFVNQRDSVRSFSGKIDDVRIYSHALTPSEVQTLYSMGR